MIRMIALLLALGSLQLWSQEKKPNIVIITVDTLRSDHLGSYGYHRNTSPNIDQLLNKGMRFTNARTIEPLTAPSLASMLTGIYPHQHGASRNGLPLFPNLISVTKLMKLKGYQTAGFVANWTLRNRLTGLGEHFDHYGEIFNRKRWFGLFLSESNATDVTKAAQDWMDDNTSKDKPFFIWVHYVEPHAPYRFQRKHATQVGLDPKAQQTKKDRYDTEIAFVDASIGEFLTHVEKHSKPENTMIVFASDHGESLGEHNYWGHGRHLYEATLHIPMGVIWQGTITPGIQSEPATILDIPSTLLGMVGFSVPPSFEGFDWAPVFRNELKASPERVTFFQAHKGAVQTKAGVEKGRQRGLLELAVLYQGQKEIFQVRNMNRMLFDLNKDPKELNSLVGKKSDLSDQIKKWALEVERGLNAALELQKQLSDTDLEKLRSLGYID